MAQSIFDPSDVYARYWIHTPWYVITEFLIGDYIDGRREDYVWFSLSHETMDGIKLEDWE